MSLFFQYPLGNPTAASPTPSTRQWSFENGLADWTPDSTSWQFSPAYSGTWALSPYHGTLFATFDAYVAGVLSGTMPTVANFAAAVGSSWTAKARIALQPNLGAVRGRVGLQWLDAGDVLLSTSWGAWIENQQSGWQMASVTATAPASTAKVRIALGAENDDATYKTGRVAFDWITLDG